MTGIPDVNEAMTHEHRHLVLNAIGSDTMRVEIGTAVKLVKRATVLLGSEGLTDDLTISDAVERAKKEAACPLALATRGRLRRPNEHG